MKEILKTEFDKIVQNSKFSKKEIEFRKENLNKFVNEGFPTKKNENWRSWFQSIFILHLGYKLNPVTR